MAGPDLPPAIQRFLADVNQYVREIERATAACKAFAEENAKAAAVVKSATSSMDRSVDRLASAYEAMKAVATGALGAIGRETSVLIEVADELKGAVGDLRTAFAGAGTAADGLKRAEEGLAGASGAAAGAAGKLSEEERVLATAAEMALRSTEALIRENVALGASEATVTAAMKAAGEAVDRLIGENAGLVEAQKALAQEFRDTVAAIVAGETAAEGAVDGLTQKVLEQIAAAKAADAAWGDLAARLKAATAAQLEVDAVTEKLAANYGSLSRAVGGTSFMSQALGERMQALAVDTKMAQEAAASLAETLALMSATYKVQAGAAESVATAYTALGAATAFVAGEQAKLTAVSLATQAALGGDSAAARDFAAKMAAAAAGTKAATAATAAANQQWAANIGWFRLTRTALHWIIAGSAEFLAVAVPAAIAFGAGMAVAAQGAQNTYNHISSVYTATEATAAAFHTTTGDVIGLGHSLQAAQNAADPGVYELLGSVIKDVKASFTGLAGTGLDVVHMLDQFSARITMDLRGAAGQQLRGMLTGMTQDLQQFGEVLGNIGHSLLNLASAMPGIAHNMLLPFLSWATGAIRIFTSLPAPIITTAMALEEFYRWGGLIASRVLVPLARQTAYYNSILPEGAGFVLRFGAALQALGHGAGSALARIGGLIGKIPFLSGAFGKVGSAVASTGEKLNSLVTRLGPGGLAGTFALVVGGAVALGIALDMDRNRTQQFIDSVNNAVGAATTNTAAFHDLAGGILSASAQMAQQEHILHSYSSAQQAAGEAVGGFITWLQQTIPPLGGAAQGMLNVASGSSVLSHTVLAAITALAPGTGAFLFFARGSAEAASKIDQLTAAQKSWLQQGRNIMANGQALAKTFGTSLPAAMSLADMAGVKLNASWKGNAFAITQAITQIHNMEQGWTAMGAPASTLGHDITAVAIQTQLAATKVQQLNQAWDAWVQSVTSGTNAMAQLQTALYGMNHAALTTGASLTGAISRINTASGKTAYTLKGFGHQAMQGWQQFDAAVQQGNASIDVLQTGLTEGVVSGKQFTSTVKAMVGEMLPFTQGNATAVKTLSQLAYRAGGQVTSSLKQLAAWAGIHGRAAMLAFDKSMISVQNEMGSVGKVAQNLSAIIQSQVQASMAATIAKSTGLDSAVVQLSKDMANAHTPASKIAQDEAALRRAYDLTNIALGEASRKWDQVVQAETRHQASIARESAAIHKADVATQGLTTRLAGMGNNAASAAGKVANSTSQKLAPLPAKLKAVGNQAVNAIVGALRGGAAKAAAATQGIDRAATGVASRLTGQFKTAGASASQGLAAGILSQQSAVVAAAGQVANAASNAAAVHLQVHSPSRLWHKYGFWAVQGLINGITDGGAKLQGAVQNLINSINRAFQGGALTAFRKSALVAQVESDNTQLQALAVQRKDIMASISAATKAYGATYSSMTSIIGLGHAPAPLTAKQQAAIPTAQGMVANLKTELGDMKKFAADLRKLAALGLDRGIISRIIAMGPIQGDAYAQAIIQAAAQSGAVPGKGGAPNPGGPSSSGPNPGGTMGGPMRYISPGGTLKPWGGPGPGGPGNGMAAIIQQLNSVYGQVQGMAHSGATSVANAMYENGARIGEGLAAGLKSREKAIEDEMRKISDVLIRRLRHDLGIHSPSQVFWEHGLMIDQGLAKGIRDGGPLVTAALRQMIAGLNPGGIRIPVLTGAGGPGGRVPLPAGHGAPNPGGPMDVHVTVEMDGMQLGAAVRKTTIRYARRNWGNGLTSRGKVS